MLRHPLRKTLGPASILMVVAVTFGVPAAHASPSNVRLTNDSPALSGYVSDYTLVTGTPYTDSILSGCSQSRGRQNEPAVAVDPRNPDVIVGSSNDYCGVFNEDGTFNGFGPSVARLLPLRERRPELRQLARARLSG